MTLFNLNMSWMSAWEFKYIYMQIHKLWPINKAETSIDKIAVSDPTKQPQFNHIIMQIDGPKLANWSSYCTCILLHPLHVSSWLWLSSSRRTAWTSCRSPRSSLPLILCVQQTCHPTSQSRLQPQKPWLHHPGRYSLHPTQIYQLYKVRYCRKPDVWGIKLKNSVGTLYIKILYGLNCVPTCMNNLIWQYPFKIADNFTEYLFCLYCPKLTISSVINVTPRHSLPTCVTSIHSLPTCVTPVHSLSTCVLYVQI